MGSPKQLLKWKETTLLQHSIDQAKQCSADFVLVVLGANYELINSQIDCANIMVLNHKHWSHGIGSSIAYGIKYVQDTLPDIDGVMITLADQPLIDTNYLDSLITRFYVDDMKIVASQYHQNQFGVPAIFNPTYFEALTQLKHDKGAKELLQKHSDHVSCLNATHLIADLDTNEDYEKLSRSNFQ